MYIADKLEYHNGSPFSTYDRDNDASNGNCAENCQGAWWYKSCLASNLNGLYLQGHDHIYSAYWYGFGGGNHVSVKRIEMKFH